MLNVRKAAKCRPNQISLPTNVYTLSTITKWAHGLTNFVPGFVHLLPERFCLRVANLQRLLLVLHVREPLAAALVRLEGLLLRRAAILCARVARCKTNWELFYCFWTLLLFKCSNPSFCISNETHYKPVAALSYK